MRISRKSLADEAYSKLLGSVMSGRFPAGSPLREEKACEALGVSRTPLREAMQRLVREGLLDRQPNRGCVVRNPPAEELEELLESRSLLECLVVRKWFHRLDQEKFKALDRRLREAGRDGRGRVAILKADEETHELIEAACPNKFIAGQLRHLRMLCGPYRVHRCLESEDSKGILDERRRIIKAVLKGDPDEAAKWLEAHFERSLSHYREAAEKNIDAPKKQTAKEKIHTEKETGRFPRRKRKLSGGAIGGAGCSRGPRAHTPTGAEPLYLRENAGAFSAPRFTRSKKRTKRGVSMKRDVSNR